MEERKQIILMVEDDAGVRVLNQKTLERRGFATRPAATLREARDMLCEQVDLILLDIMLPDGSGLDFVTEIRTATAAPILMLTSKKEDGDIVAGLLGGGDDYMTKPYKVDELHARIVALLRRTELARAQSRQPQKYGCLTMDQAAGRAFWDEKDMLLKPKEFSLLCELLDRRGEYFTAEALYEKLWGAPLCADDHSLRTSIYRLRKRITAAGADITIEQEKSKGYRLAME